MWRRLRDVGCDIVSTWIDEAGAGETASMSNLWERVTAEIYAASRCVVYVHRDDFPLKGALVEVGMALGTGTPVIVVAPSVPITNDYRPIGSWLAHPLVTRNVSILDAVGPFLCRFCGCAYACAHKESVERYALESPRDPEDIQRPR